VILAEIAVGGNPDVSGVVEACSQGGADGGSAAVVLIVGGGEAEAFAAVGLSGSSLRWRLISLRLCSSEADGESHRLQQV
jgi:hypothetical protein